MTYEEYAAGHLEQIEPDVWRCALCKKLVMNTEAHYNEDHREQQ